MDLRQEAHGFVDETPVSAYAPRNWGNLGRGRTGALAAEARFLEDLRERVARDGALTFPGHPKDHRIARDFPGELGRVTPQPERVAARAVRAEEEVVRSIGAGYQRLLITDHQGPTLDELERFEAVLGELPAGTWVHFHCRGGKGRAATFLLLYDILRNAHQVALSALLLRQRLLSRYAIDELAAPGDWKRPYQEERLLQVRAFYARRRAAAR